MIAAAPAWACLGSPTVDHRPAEPDAAGPAPDIDAAPPSCDDPLSLPFRPSNLDPCDLVGPRGALALTEPVESGVYWIDTDSGMLTGPEVDFMPASAVVEQEGAPDILVIIASSLEIAPGAELHADGSRALALVVPGDIDIGGILDVGAVRGKGDSRSGPGGDDDEACAQGRGGPGAEQAAGDTDDLRAGSGGGGGGFADAGGAGGAVSEVEGALPSPGGLASGNRELVPLRGGCAGGKGGWRDGNGGGGGGGALQLVAGGRLHVQEGAVVTARGGGGLGVHDTPGDGGGGGGGGSGGGLLFEATAIAVDGAVTANGGGGGEGSLSVRDTQDGESGRDTESARALGGNDAVATNRGGAGGSGGAGQGVDGLDGDAGGEVEGTPLPGGGGGGGSAGRIHLRYIDESVSGSSATFSPPAFDEVIEPTARP